MSGTEQAATLTLEIKTDQARASLNELAQAYETLKSQLSNSSRSAGVDAIGQSAAETNARIKTLETQIATLNAKLASTEVAAEKVRKSFTQNLGLDGLGKQFIAGEKGLEGFAAALAEVHKETVGLAQMGVSLQQVGKDFKVGLMMADESVNGLARSINFLKGVRAELEAGGQHTVIHKYGEEAVLATEKITLLETKLAELRGQQTMSKMSAPSMIRTYDEASAINARLNVNSYDALYAEEYAAEQKAAANRVALEQRTRAQLKVEQDGELRDLEQAIAKEKAIQDAANAQRKAQANWLAQNEKQRAASTLKAAQAYYGGADQSALAGNAGSTYALEAAQNLGSVKAAQSALDDLSLSHAKVGTAAKEAAVHQTRWNTIASDGHAVARGLSGSLGTLWMTYGAIVPLMAGAALGSGFLEAAKAGADLSYQLTFVKALSGESAAAVDSLSAATMKLAKSSAFGPTEIASGFRILAQAGVNVTDSLKAMPEVLNLATVGEMNMEQAATTLIGVMNAFGLKIGAVSHVGDVFAKAGAESQTSVQAMTEAMKTASVVGEQYGASMEDTATALTLLAKVNITGTAAGTSFRNMLKELYSPTKEAAGVLEKLKISTKDASTGGLRQFTDIIYDLQGKLKEFDKSDQTKILQKIFGERGAKEAIVMLSQTREEWNRLSASISNSDGFNKGVTDQLNDTVQNKWKMALNTMRDQLTSTFLEMEPQFKNLADSFKGMFDDPAFVNGLKTIVSGMLSLTETAVKAAPTLITLAEAWLVLKAAMIGAAVWTSVSTALGVFATSMQAASGVMGPGLTAMAGMKGVLAGMPSMFAALGSPISIAIGALVGLGTAMYLFKDRTADAMEASAKKVEDFGKITAGILSDVTKSIDSMNAAVAKTQLGKAWESMKPGMDNLSSMQDQMKSKYGVSGIGEARAYVDQTDLDASGSSSAYDSAIVAKNSAKYKSLKAYIAAYDELNKKIQETSQLEAKASIKETAEAAIARAKSETPAVKIRSAQDILNSTNNAREKSAQFYAERSSISEEFRNASKMAQEEYNSEKRVINQMYRDRLIGEQEFYDLRSANEEKYQTALSAAAKNANDALSTLSNGADRESQKMWIANQRERVANQLQEQAWMDAINQREQQRLSLIKLQAEARTFTTKTVPKETATLRAKYEKSWDERDADLMSPQDSAATKARADVDAVYKRVVASKQEELEAVNAQVEAQDRLDASLGQCSLASEVLKQKQATLRGEIASASESFKTEADNAAELATKLVDHSRSFEYGWTRAFTSFANNANSSAESARTIFESMSSSMTSAIVTFATTGKMSFKSFAISVMTEATKVMANKAVAGLLGTLGNLAISYFSSGSSSGNYNAWSGSSGASSSNMTTTYNNAAWSANGNVFSGTSGLSQYVNTVQDSPKYFGFNTLHQFAKGGVFAEAGPEAVMPLARDSAGRLGVRAQGGGDGGTQVNINITVNQADGSSDKSTSSGDADNVWKQMAGRIRGIVVEEITTQKRPGGQLYAS